MRKFVLILGLFWLFSGSAWAQQVFPCAAAMPFSFVNGTVADANQVNSNFSTLLACANAGGRIAITASFTMSVASTGSDTNNACTTPATPCATIQRAINILQQYYQYSNCAAVVTIQLSVGSYNQSTEVAGRIPGQCLPTQIVISGGSGSPDATALTGTGSFAIEARSGGLISVQNLECLNPTGDCLRATEGGILVLQNIDFNTAAAAQIHVDRYGVAQSTGNYTVSGGANAHIWTDGEATYRWFAAETLNPCCSTTGITVTISGTPAFANSFVRAVSGLVDARSLTFVNPGSATGAQCNVSNNGVLRTSTAGTLVFPGTASTCGTSTGGIFN